MVVFLLVSGFLLILFFISFTIHHLAIKSFIRQKDLGPEETPENDKEDVFSISIESGVMSSFTVFIIINKELNQSDQGPLAIRDIPMKTMCGSLCLVPSGEGSGEFYPIHTHVK